MMLPKVFIIEPTNTCNLRCPTCHVGQGILNRPKRHLKLEEFKLIIDQSKGYLRKVMLFNLGEPLLNPHLTDMIRYAADANIKVTISTNCELLSEEMSLQLLNSGLSRLIICLDGVDQETLSMYRVGSSFEKVINNIRFLTTTKKQLQKGPIIEFQFIVMKHNEYQRQQMEEIATNLSVDEYAEKTVGIDINNPKFQELAHKLVASNSRYVYKDGQFLNQEIVGPCKLINKMLVINSDGSVLPCCYDFMSDHIMGNVFTDSIESIWNSSKYVEFREQIFQDRRAVKICASCSEGRAKLYVTH